MHELGVTDLAVFVLVKRIEDCAQFLSREEHSELAHELFKLQLAERAVAVFVELLLQT